VRSIRIIALIGAVATVSLACTNVSAAGGTPVYLAVFQGDARNAGLVSRPTEFHVDLTPHLGAGYHVTRAHWLRWGRSSARARVSGNVICNMSGVCGRFRAELAVSRIRKESVCGLRTYTRMTVRHIVNARTGKSLRAGGRAFLTTVYRCPG
jgi:hypothetical protein